MCRLSVHEPCHFRRMPTLRPIHWGRPCPSGRLSARNRLERGATPSPWRWVEQGVVDSERFCEPVQAREQGCPRNVHRPQTPQHLSSLRLWNYNLQNSIRPTASRESVEILRERLGDVALNQEGALLHPETLVEAKRIDRPRGGDVRLRHE